MAETVARQRSNPLHRNGRVTGRNTALLLLASAVLAIAVFANATTGQFVWDDNDLIADNPAVHSLSNIPGFFSSHFWSQSNQPSARGYYRPVVLLSYAIDYVLWGGRPFGFHLTNILLHAVATALVCMLVLQLIGSPVPAIVAGLLFAVLPIHVESVAFISGRTDVLATVFTLLSLSLFVRARRTKRMFPATAAAVVFFGLALLSKEVAAVLPVLLLCLEMVRPVSRPARERLALHLPFWLVLAGYLGLRFGLLHIRPEIQGSLSLSEIALTMPGIVLDYLRLFVFPSNLCADYAVSVQRSVSPGNLAAAGTLLLAALLVGFFLYRKSIGAFFAFWIFLGLLPVLQFVPISVLKAERFLYLPSVGYCAVAGLAGAALLERSNRHRRRISAAVSMLILAAYSFVTIGRNPVWRNELRLYEQTASCAPNNFRVQYNLGNAYFRAGDLERAITHTRIAHELKPNFPRAAYNLGVMYESAGKTNEAERMYREAIELDPNYALAHNNLAAILYRNGHLDEAETEWLKALALDKNLEQAKQGLLLLDQQRQMGSTVTDGR